jgi:glycine hydroxymethyltransferase
MPSTAPAASASCRPRTCSARSRAASWAATSRTGTCSRTHSGATSAASTWPRSRRPRRSSRATCSAQRHVNVRPLSGENCTNIVIHALWSRVTVFYHLGMHDGGHFAANSVAARMTERRRRLLPYDAARATFDLDACARSVRGRAARRHLPRRVDGSCSAPARGAAGVGRARRDHRVRRLSGARADRRGALPGPAPRRRGRPLGSTHKSLPGPQKGIIMTNRADIMARVEATIFPGHVSNFHLHHVAALAVTLAETQAFGADYASADDRQRPRARRRTRTARTRRAGRRARDDVAPGLARRARSRDPDEAVERLHAANLIVNVNLIPSLRAKGLRLGTPEVTRLGMGEAEMRVLAGLIHVALTRAPAHRTSYGSRRAGVGTPLPTRCTTASRGDPR